MRFVASVLAVGCGVVGMICAATGATSGSASAANATTTSTTAPSSATTTTQPTISWSVEPATAKGVTGKPAFIYSDVAPGTVLHDYVGVTNYSTFPVTFAVYPADAVNTTTGGYDVVRQGQKSVGVGAWTTLARSTVTIPAGLEENIPFTLQVPMNATPGDHYGGIMAQISSTSTGKGGKFLLNRRVGARVYLSVVGPLHPSLAIQNLTVNYDGTVNPFAAGAATVDYTVTNNGNVALAGSQAVTITSIFGNLGSKSPGPIVNLVPGQSQEVKVTFAGVPPAGPIDANVSLTPSLPKGTTGKVTKLPATLASLRRSVGTWAWPSPQFVLFVLLFLVLWRWRRWRKRRGSKLERAVAAAREEGRREAEIEGQDADTDHGQS